MIRSEERDLRDGLMYDPVVKGYDSVFWQADSGADLTADTVKGGLKIGDTGVPGSISSFSQYLYGDFEFLVSVDSLSPDSNDSEKYFGLRNIGDTVRRGAVYFDMSYDTTAADSSSSTRPFAVVAYDEYGNRTRKEVTWDTNWGGSGRMRRFRLLWEADGYRFMVDDTVVATIMSGDIDSTTDSEISVNTNIAQALRLSNRSLDTTDTSVATLKLLTVRHSRKVI